MFFDVKNAFSNKTKSMLKIIFSNNNLNNQVIFQYTTSLKPLSSKDYSIKTRRKTA